jgi:hypothetical protein
VHPSLILSAFLNLSWRYADFYFCQQMNIRASLGLWLGQKPHFSQKTREMGHPRAQIPKYQVPSTEASKSDFEAFLSFSWRSA